MTQETNDVVTQELIERLERELRRRSLGKPVTEYGRGWNCGLEEAEDIVRAELQSQSARIAEPIPMLLYCPQCGQHHVDEPDERTPDWTNPPHRSHLCHDCGCIWRPADVPTTGVRAIQTKGKADTWTADRGNAEAVSLTKDSTSVTE